MRALGAVLAVLLALLATAALAAWLAGWEMTVGSADMRGADFARLAAIAALMASGTLAATRQRLSQTFFMMVSWATLFLVVVLAYSYRDDVERLWARIRGELFVGEAVTTGPGQVQVTRSSDAHFYVEADVNAAPIVFMVDTGATMVALSWDDARLAGFEPEDLRFDRKVNTASGQAMVAPVRIDRLVIGPIERKNISAVVLPENVGSSLLGLAFLDTLSSYEISGDRMTMRN